jgi:hypothetical protein
MGFVSRLDIASTANIAAIGAALAFIGAIVVGVFENFRGSASALHRSGIAAAAFGGGFLCRASLITPYDSGQDRSVTCQEVLFSTMPHRATRAPAAVLRQALSPTAKVRPPARQTQSAE